LKVGLRHFSHPAALPLHRMQPNIFFLETELLLVELPLFSPEAGLAAGLFIEVWGADILALAGLFNKISMASFS
jgi:hypothetical protein